MVDNPYKIAGNILSASLESDYNFRSVDLYGSSVRGKEDSLCSEFHLENESTGISPCTRYFRYGTGL